MKIIETGVIKGDPPTWYFSHIVECHTCSTKWKLDDGDTKLPFWKQFKSKQRIKGDKGVYYSPLTHESDGFGGVYFYVVVWCPVCGERQRSYKK